MRIKWFLGVFAMVISLNSHAINYEHIVWEKMPILISLSPDKERLIRFPQPITVVDSELGDKVNVLKVQDVLYLKAKEPFSNKRLLVQLMPQGEVIVLSLSAQENMDALNPVEILLNQESNDIPAKSTGLDINAITLTRFAIQSLYSPERLLVIPQGISRTPMQAPKTITLFYGASLLARPLVSWKGGDLYITAVEIKNQLNKDIVLNPNQIVGNWQTATFYPTNTLQARRKEDTTTVFLTSDKPFSETLNHGREFIR